jgi:hypothetical protein
MQKQVNPIAALCIVLAVLAAIGYVVWSRTQLDTGQVQLSHARPKSAK